MVNRYRRLASLWVLVGMVAILWSFQGLAKGRRELINGKEAAANEVLVKLRAQNLQSLLDIGSAEDVDEAEEVGGAGVLRLHSSKKDVSTLVRELSVRSDVIFAEPNYIVHATAVPNDPRFGELWGLQNTGQVIQGVAGTPGADIGAVPAWDISTGSTANVAAVIDTGIDYTHLDLAANVWSAPAAFTVTIGGRSITCPAASHGFNAITNVCDPMDDNNHGSHVSGTIGAVGNNGVGVVGVNWIARIMGSKFLDSTGSGTTANAINAIEFTIQAKAAFGGSTGATNVRVLNNSWGGGGFSQALLDEINRANANDMLFVAAAGNASSNNDATPNYPSNYNAPNVVAVAATDNSDTLAFFSNFGATTVHLGAPGVDILSTTLNGTYSYFSGTSMATPHVSGAALLVLSQCALNSSALKTDILNNIDPIPSLAGITITGGRLNVNKAIRACAAPANPDFALSATPTSQTVVQGTGTSYTVNIARTGGFTGAVNLSVTGLPAGATASLSPNPASGTSSTLSVSTSATTPAGSYVLTITGVSGALTHTTTVTLVVAAAGAADFALSASPSSQIVLQGTSGNYTVTITPSGGFSSAVTLSVSGLPALTTAGFSSNPATGSSVLTVNVDPNTPVGTYTLTITGTSGTLTHTTLVTLVVDFGD